MKKSSFLFLFVTFLFPNIYAQKQRVKFTNARDFDENRYSEIKGSPFYFKDWVSSTIYGTDHSVYENILINYNGYTQTFEATKDGKWIELNLDWIRRIEVKKKGNEKVFKAVEGEEVIFQRILHPDFPDKFAVLYYEGKNIQMMQEWRVALSEKKVETPGKTQEFERFMVKENYYLLKAGDLYPVKLKKKSLLPALGKVHKLEAFAKKEKLKFDSKEDLKRLLRFFEGLD